MAPRARFLASSHHIPLFHSTAQIYLPSVYIYLTPLALKLQGQTCRSRNIVPVLPTKSALLAEMDLLEMPLEALVLRLNSLPTATARSLWTCLAVLATALGLWRIRAVGSRSEASLPASTPAPKLGPAEPAQAPAPAPAPAPTQCHVEDVSPPKARFMAYYDSCDWFDVEDDGDEEAKVDGGRGVDGIGDGTAPLAAPWEGFPWEGLMVWRRGDLGWYRYQDLTALNGSVVRLWDGDGVLTAASRRTSLIGL